MAPIGIPVYTRLTHFKKAIKALQQNEVAEFSELFVFSDKASCKEDEYLVSKVREFAHSIEGFKSVSVVERQTNFGGAKNPHEGIKELTRKFKKVIYMEDDIEVAPGFLSFMNSALDFYEYNDEVISISGYSLPIHPERFTDKDFYVLNRFCGWGCGVYERTIDWLARKISPEEFSNVGHESELCEFGSDVYRMSKREMLGELDSADVRCMFRQALYGGATIYPQQSLVQNNGHDGTGFNCVETNRFRHKKLWSKLKCFKFEKNVQVNNKIKLENRAFRDFQGRYYRFKKIFNSQQIKSISSAILREYHENIYEEFFSNKSLVSQTKKRIVFISTSGCNLTSISNATKHYFGKSVCHHWFHRDLVEIYLERNRLSNAKDYLLHLHQIFFSTSPYDAFHITIPQLKYWSQNFDIDLIDFFEFDSVLFVKSRDYFREILFYAVTTETGLYSSYLRGLANISDNFNVKLVAEQIICADEALVLEMRDFEKYTNKYIIHCISYENLCTDTYNILLAAEKFPLLSDEKTKSIHFKIENENKMICDKNISQLSAWFNARTSTN